MLVYKDSKCYVENSFACAPAMTVDSGDKTEEESANLLVCGKCPVTGRAHEQTFAYDIFSLPHKSWRASFYMTFFLCHKNWRASFSANEFVAWNLGKFSHVHEQIKMVTENLPQELCSCGLGFGEKVTEEEENETH